MDLTAIKITIVILGLLVFFFLKPRIQVLLSFFIMSSGFDLLPDKIMGQHTWDYGMILLLLTGINLIIRRSNEPSGIYKYAHIHLLSIFLIWMSLCFVYSILIYEYPLLLTIKNARGMILGYFSLFVFLKLFSFDERSLHLLLKYLYWITLTLMTITIIQRISGLQILHGLYRDYGDTQRYLPSYLPICLLFFWIISGRFLSSGRVPFHSIVFSSLVLVVVGFTYTRGIYIAFSIIAFSLFILLFRKGKLNFKYTGIAVSILIIVLSVTNIVGWTDNVYQRMSSGIGLIFSDNNAKKDSKDEDTFTVRIKTVKERFQFAYQKNYLLGFGFMHEDLVPYSLRTKIKYGSPISLPEYLERYKYGMPHVLALYSVDIGWGDMVLKTGFVGLLLFFLIILFFSLTISKWGRRDIGGVVDYVRLGLYLQTIMLVILMFNGDTFTRNVHVPMFLIAAYTYLLSKKKLTKPLSFLGEKS